MLPGVADLIDVLQVEPMFEDGQKLVTVHEPIGPGSRAGRGRRAGRGATGRRRDRAERGAASGDADAVRNTGDRPVQVGSHYHFFEVNDALEFDRGAAFGMRLDIPAGTAVRFEPGDEREVELVELGGDARSVHGLNRLTEGETGEQQREAALERAARRRASRGA